MNGDMSTQYNSESPPLPLVFLWQFNINETGVSEFHQSVLDATMHHFAMAFSGTSGGFSDLMFDEERGIPLKVFHFFLKRSSGKARYIWFPTGKTSFSIQMEAPWLAFVPVCISDLVSRILSLPGNEITRALGRNESEVG